MDKFIPYEKLSKKEKRKLDLSKRQTWGELNPVTRKPQNSKAYNRRKAQSWKRDSSSVPFVFRYYSSQSEISWRTSSAVPLASSWNTSCRASEIPQSSTLSRPAFFICL